ncbi:MAG: hypothetical protein IPP76_11050 [Moraxellaceae bacterium]|nr:hypothetical protein [Moraxellaceae bacterium]
MAFVEVKPMFSTENNALYNSLLGNGVKVGMLDSWFMDKDINAHLFNYGGRGELPEELGMPPDTSLLVINKTIYHIEYREKLVEVDNGYEIEFSICHFSVKGEEVIPRPQVYKILEQAFFDYVQVLKEAYINAGHKFSIVLLP